MSGETIRQDTSTRESAEMTAETRREHLLRGALHRLYLETLSEHEGYIGMVPNRFLRAALVNAAHMLDYHDKCSPTNGCH